MQREPTAATEGGVTHYQPATAPTFYSAVERAVTNAKQAKASPEQWLATLRNTPGVKPEEMKWLGLEDWLKGQKGPISRDDVAAYVRANALQVEEVTHGRRGDESPENIEAVARWIAREEEGGDRWDQIGGAGQYRYLRDAERQLRGLPTKFETYRLPGGENYRELLLTLPAKEQTAPLGPRGWAEVGNARTAAGDVNYRSPHWDEPNIVAHVRFDDRTVDGQRALHLAEVQSDWHQQGRKVGYKGPPTNIDTAPLKEAADDAHRAVGIRRDELMKQVSDGRYASKREMLDAGDRSSLIVYESLIKNDHELKRLEAKHEDALRAWGDARDSNLGRGPGVPDAPFKTTWPELAIKRMIRHAAENGYDRLTWDTGETNAARYDLSKRISEVNLSDNTSGGISRAKMEGPLQGGMLRAYDHDRRMVLEQYVRTEKEIEDAIGKDAAERLLASAPRHATSAGMGVRLRSLEGMDLKVGGEGMQAFYDNMLPSMVTKLTKKFGGKVEDARTNSVFKSQEDAGKALAGEIPWPEGTPVHSLTITPELREAAVGEGFPLFQPGAATARASVTMRDNHTIMTLFEGNDQSSLIHEGGHKFLSELATDATTPNAPQQLKDDLQTTLDWLGAKDPDSITDEQHEKFARGFESYLRDGSAPSARLASVFERFKQWLMQIYRRLKEVGGRISPEMRGVFDRMLATDEEIAAARSGAKPTVVTGDSLVDHVTSNPYVASAIADPVINRTNDVPYGAGPNKNLDRVVNIDRHVPVKDTIGGVTYDPARAVAVHEFVEQHALNELTKAGVPEAHAYEIAHFVFAEPAERAWVEANIGPKAWKPYQAHWSKWLKPIENENPKNPPPDLYQKPYPHDDDHLAPEDRGSDKAFEETGHRNLSELRVEAERVLGPGGGGAAAQIEQAARQAVANAHQALSASGTPLDRALDQVISEQVEPFLDRAFPKAVEAGPEGTQQTLVPGVEPVTDADRLRAVAGKPMTGGAAAMPEGGLFDENATQAQDLFDMVATDRGLVPRDKLMTGVPLENSLGPIRQGLPSMTIKSCIDRAVNDGEINPDTAAALEAEYLGLARTMGAKAAQGKLQQSLDIRGQIVKRQQMLMVQAHDGIVKNLLQYRDAKGRRNIFDAGELHFEDFGYAGFPNARFLGEGMIGYFNSTIADFMDHFSRKTFYSNASLIGGRNNKADMIEVQKAMFGESHISPVSEALSKALLETHELARQLYNEVSGGTIGKLENWGGPQSHDPSAVMNAGGMKDPAKARKVWSEYIDKQLDWPKIRDPFTDEPFGRVPDA